MRSSILARLLLLPLVACYRAGVPQCSASAAAAVPSAAHTALQSVPVSRVSDSASVSLTSQWSADERAMVVFFRSFG